MSSRLLAWPICRSTSAAAGCPQAVERLLDLGALLVGQQPLDHAPHVGLVVDRVAVAAAEHAGVLAQQPRAHGVEGGGGHAARPLFAEQVGQPQAQFAGGAHAEGDREDLPRRRAAGRQQVGDAAGEGAGLARPGPGHEQQRPGAVPDRGALLGREVPGEGARLRAGRARVGRTRGGVGHASPPGDCVGVERPGGAWRRPAGGGRG